MLGNKISGINTSYIPLQNLSELDYETQGYYNLTPILSGLIKWMKGANIRYDPRKDPMIIQAMNHLNTSDLDTALNYCKQFAKNIDNLNGNIDIEFLKKIIVSSENNYVEIFESLMMYDEERVYKLLKPLESNAAKIISNCGIDISSTKGTKVFQAVCTKLNNTLFDELDQINGNSDDRDSVNWNRILKNLEPNDIVFKGRIILNRSQLLKTDAFDQTAKQNKLTQLVNNLSNNLEQIVSNIVQEIAPEHQNINYSRFDYAGGNEDDDYKLALDSCKTDQDKLEILYEAVLNRRKFNLR